MITKSCVACGVDFEVDDTKRNWQSKKLCSAECQKTHTNAQSRLKYTQIQWPQKKVCIRCNADFLVHEGGNMARKYCGMECQLSAKAEKQAAEVDARRSPKKCEFCGSAFIHGKYSHKQRFCSSGCRSKARNIQQYAVGATKSKIRNSYKYDFKFIKPQIIERDGNRCTVCGSDEKLHVHHRDNSGGKDGLVNNSDDNLTTMCGVCHYAIHGVTLAFVNGAWVLDGKIFDLLGLTGAIPIKT